MPPLVLVIALGAITLWTFRTFAFERMDDVRIQQQQATAEKLKGQVDIAMTMVENAYMSAGPDTDIDQVKAEVLTRISDLRFGGNDLDYIWVHSYDPLNVEKTTMLMHPTIPSLDGTDISDYRDMERFNSIYFEGKVYPTTDPKVAHIRETNLFVEMNKVCQSQNGGTVEYYWPRPVKGGATPEGHHKMSYVERFPPWNWVIGTGAYIDYIDGIVAAEQGKVKAKEAGIFITFITALLVVLVTGIAISIWIARLLGSLYEDLAAQLERNKKISEELSVRNTELELAMQEVKTLSGLLPICAYCKQIRDDKGYWNQMEAYIAKRSEAQFSHSICPECVKRHFPDLEMEDQ